MTDLKQMSLMEAAEQILRSNKEPMTFYELFHALSEAKELSELDRQKLIAQFYADFIISAKFIYMGEDRWDLKSRQSIDLWDKDGAYYQEFPEDDEEVEIEEVDDEIEEDDEDDELEEEDVDVIEPDFEAKLDEEFEEEDDLLVDEEETFDDDKYNEYMDDYEDMYDE